MCIASLYSSLSSKLPWLDLTMFLSATGYMACDVFWVLFYASSPGEPFSSEIGNMRFCDARKVSAETQMKHLANI